MREPYCECSTWSTTFHYKVGSLYVFQQDCELIEGKTYILLTWLPGTRIHRLCHQHLSHFCPSFLRPRPRPSPSSPGILWLLPNGSCCPQLHCLSICYLLKTKRGFLNYESDHATLWLKILLWCPLTLLSLQASPHSMPSLTLVLVTELLAVSKMHHAFFTTVSFMCQERA